MHQTSKARLQATVTGSTLHTEDMLERLEVNSIRPIRDLSHMYGRSASFGNTLRKRSVNSSLSRLLTQPSGGEQAPSCSRFSYHEMLSLLVALSYASCLFTTATAQPSHLINDDATPKINEPPTASSANTFKPRNLLSPHANPNASISTPANNANASVGNNAAICVPPAQFDPVRIPHPIVCGVAIYRVLQSAPGSTSRPLLWQPIIRSWTFEACKITLFPNPGHMGPDFFSYEQLADWASLILESCAIERFDNRGGYGVVGVRGAFAVALYGIRHPARVDHPQLGTS